MNPTPEAAPVPPEPERPVGLGTLWRQFLPLSLSDVTMALSTPLVNMVLGHGPHAAANLAAAGVARTLAVLFESPIIMVLHAANVLAGRSAARRAFWRLVLLMTAGLTLSLGLLAMPAVFDTVAGRLLGLTPEVTARAHVVLLFLLLWPATIGWRRYFQGLLIHAGHLRTIGVGGLSRLLATITALWLGTRLALDGPALAGLGTVAGIGVEAALIMVAAWYFRVGARPDTGTGPLAVSLGDSWRFYRPLAAVMLVVWGSRLGLVAVVARAHDAAVGLAVWAAAGAIIMLVANALLMVQQVVIRQRHRASRKLLLQFAVSAGLVGSAVMLLIAGTPVGHRIVGLLIGPQPELVAAAVPVLLLGSPGPLIVALMATAQGWLIGDGHTAKVYGATWLGAAILVGVGIAGVAAGLAGATAAGVATLTAIIAETAWLGLQVRAVATTTGLTPRVD